jgi:spore maturation protein CgeB
MSGGLQVCSYSKELATYFEENKEIIFFKNKSDLLNKVNFYLAADNKIINQMKDNAKAKAIKSHTWYNRFLDIFKELNLLENI